MSLSICVPQVKKLERELRMAQAGEGLNKDSNNNAETNSSGSAAGTSSVEISFMCVCFFAYVLLLGWSIHDNSKQ